MTGGATKSRQAAAQVVGVGGQPPRPHRGGEGRADPQGRACDRHGKPGHRHGRDQPAQAPGGGDAQRQRRGLGEGRLAQPGVAEKDEGSPPGRRGCQEHHHPWIGPSSAGEQCQAGQHLREQDHHDRAHGQRCRQLGIVDAIGLEHPHRVTPGIERSQTQTSAGAPEDHEPGEQQPGKGHQQESDTRSQGAPAREQLHPDRGRQPDQEHRQERRLGPRLEAYDSTERDPERPRDRGFVGPENAHAHQQNQREDGGPVGRGGTERQTEIREQLAVGERQGHPRTVDRPDRDEQRRTRRSRPGPLRELAGSHGCTDDGHDHQRGQREPSEQHRGLDPDHPGRRGHVPVDVPVIPQRFTGHPRDLFRQVVAQLADQRQGDLLVGVGPPQIGERDRVRPPEVVGEPHQGERDERSHRPRPGRGHLDAAPGPPQPPMGREQRQADDRQRPQRCQHRHPHGTCEEIDR